MTTMMNATQQNLDLFSRPLPDQAATVWRALERNARGRENAIPMRDLAERCGLSTRNLQSAIEYLIREAAKPIGSSCGKVNGYYVIENQADLEETYRNRMRRGIANLTAAYALKRSPQVAAALGQLQMHETEAV